MNAQEKAAIQALLKMVVDTELPMIVAAEEQRLPALYQPVVNAVVSAVLPQIQAALDAAIAKV